ncbi:hypothetical protein CHARACLAT_012467 [Characodon lateralis]|uniref:Uncharacterized protein n=1 Tax=Characodon lateralis TaxID=208331 RepID=A0ABU7E394_9TELE|nr:hypothetical protein [Characodon lateralis]
MAPRPLPNHLSVTPPMFFGTSTSPLILIFLSALFPQSVSVTFGACRLPTVLRLLSNVSPARLCPLLYLEFPFALDPNLSLALLHLSRGIHQPAISLPARHTLQPAKGTSEAYYSKGTLIRALG